MGSILCLASQSRPDLIYSTTRLSRRSNWTTARDMAAADRLLRYIASTASLGITYSDSKSHTGVSLHMGQFSGSFLTLSKKQSILTDSTTVSEFFGTHSAVPKNPMSPEFSY